RVTVGQETFLYAHNDVKPTDPKEAKEAAKLPQPKPEYQTLVEIHRWLEEARPIDPKTNRTEDSTVFPVGEWVVADRGIVHPGEYLTPRQEMEVPTWLITEEKWGIASLRASAKKKVVQLEITTGTSLDHTLLVDFQGGPGAPSYTKVTGTTPDPTGSGPDK